MVGLTLPANERAGSSEDPLLSLAFWCGRLRHVASVRDCVRATRVQLIRQDRGVFDTFPLSLITSQTIAGLSETAGAPLDVQRLRPNILVQASDGGGFPEDGWVGCVLRIGVMCLRIDKRDDRCVVITIDPLTTERNLALSGTQLQHP